MKKRAVRIALSVPPDIDVVLTAISKATNTPKTHIITDLLRDSLPVFQTALEALRQLQENRKEAAVQTMADFLGKASQGLNQAHLELGEMRGRNEKS